MTSFGAITRTMLSVAGGFAIGASGGCSLPFSEHMRSERARGSSYTARSPGPVATSLAANEPRFVFVEDEATENSCEIAELRAELDAMMNEDQKWRRQFRSQNALDTDAVEKLRTVDVRNTARMREIVDTYGWPMKSMVGAGGAHSAWLLVQHADRDVAFQRRCLTLMQTLVEIDEVRRVDVAYLTDRVLVNEDKPQIYGTQFHLVSGNSQPRPIEDAKNETVAQRHKSFGGLQLLDESLRLIMPLSTIADVVEASLVQGRS